MSTVKNQPTDLNPLSPLGFKFVINRAPNVNWFVDSVILPGISLNDFDVPNPFIKYPLPGTELTFGNFEVSFMVDENMNNYFEIYDWMIALGFPDTFDQYKVLADSSPATGLSVLSDASLVIMNSAMKSNLKVEFADMFPVSLSPLAFNTQLTDVQYIMVNVQFKFRRFYLSRSS